MPTIEGDEKGFSYVYGGTGAIFPYEIKNLNIDFMDFYYFEIKH